jgi:hypothetical protein
VEELVMTQVQDLVTADLRGGPAAFPDELRHPRVAPGQDEVKICHYGGYEHFERDLRESGWVYRWTGRTRIAE